jgi:hypothetical protein
MGTRKPPEHRELAKHEHRMGLITRIIRALTAQREVIDINADGELKDTMQRISDGGLDAAEKLRDELAGDFAEYQRRRRK